MSKIIIMIIFISAMIITSLIVSFCYFKQNCSLGNFLVYLLFNLGIITILIFQFVAICDYYIYFQEYLNISSNSEYDEIKKHIKNFYKAAYYIFYIFSDVLFPFGTKFYLLNHQNENSLFKKSLKACKGLLFFFLFIIVSTIVIVVVTYYYPEPVIDDIEKNYEGWDGFIFNLRNVCSLFEIEYYINLFYYFIVFKGYARFFSTPCCKCNNFKETKKNLFALWTLGKLIKESDDQEKLKNDNELNDVELALKEIKDERKNDLINKIMDDLNNTSSLGKILKDISLGFLSIVFGLCILFFEPFNSVDGLYKVNYSTLKSDWEKNEEDRENIEYGILFDLTMYFFFSYIYIFILIYMFFQKKYIKEYLPYIGGNHNGYGLIIILKFLMEKVLLINYLIFFPFINFNHKAIIQSYFKLISFNLDVIWVLLIKLFIVFFPSILVVWNFAHEELFYLAKYEEYDDYVKIGAKYFLGPTVYNIYYSLSSLTDNYSNSDDDDKSD